MAGLSMMAISILRAANIQICMEKNYEELNTYIFCSFDIYSEHINYYFIINTRQ